MDLEYHHVKISYSLKKEKLNKRLISLVKKVNDTKEEIEEANANFTKYKRLKNIL